MAILSLNHVVKKYRDHTAVNDVTFDIQKGSIFGLLGPNGAGKTSLIRMITMITGPDSGEILLDGKRLDSSHIQNIGYLPEERGLYKKMKVAEQLLYLAQLRGLSLATAKQEVKYWLDKFDASDWWNKTIEELSKGMQQKIQFIATVLHKPNLIILDEPFTGLDPMNTNLIKEEIYRMNSEGVSIIFSTHRMEQVEEICKDIVLINNGKVVQTGTVEGVKQKYKEHVYKVEFETAFQGNLSDSAYTIVSQDHDSIVIQNPDETSGNDLLVDLIKSGAQIKSFNEMLPSLNDVFIKIVENTNQQ
jgi:ABC-2 type transport system ATP-binding protein